MARPKLNPDYVEKTCKTCNKQFKVNFYKRKIQEYCSKMCAANNIDVKEKNKTAVAASFKSKYGCHPMQTTQGKANFNIAIKNKYGVEHYSKTPEYNIKVRKTKLDRYGDEKYTNIDKIKETVLLRYGVDNIRKFKPIVDECSEARLTAHYNYLINFLNTKHIELMCDRTGYKGYHFSNKYTFKCKTCTTVFEKTLYKPEDIICEFCNPEQKDTLENEFYNFLHTVVSPETIIKRNDRTILVGKELDFYIPDKKIAFELNGLYWHSEMGKGLHKNYHLNKTKSCAYHNIKLVHIFENEFKNKKEIVKSIVRTLLNSADGYKRIYARECIIKEVQIKEKNKFLNENHLQGEDKSTVKLGLYYHDELVSIMTFRKNSRFDKNVDWELMRFCNKLNTSITGGASKLFSHFINNYNHKYIVTYSDRRYFGGEIYAKLGFKFIDFTPVNYYYIMGDYKELKHRMSFQKHKLSKILTKYDESLSEWSNMKNNGYDRIWDCGNSKFIYTNNT